MILINGALLTRRVSCSFVTYLIIKNTQHSHRTHDDPQSSTSHHRHQTRSSGSLYEGYPGLRHAKVHPRDDISDVRCCRVRLFSLPKKFRYQKGIRDGAQARQCHEGMYDHVCMYVMVSMFNASHVIITKSESSLTTALNSTPTHAHVDTALKMLRAMRLDGLIPLKFVVGVDGQKTNVLQVSQYLMFRGMKLYTIGIFFNTGWRVRRCDLALSYVRVSCLWHIINTPISLLHFTLFHCSMSWIFIRPYLPSSTRCV